MNQRAKKYLALSGLTGALLLLDAYYTGHIVDACDSEAQKPPFYLGLILFLAFIGFVGTVPLGNTRIKKIIYSLAKIALILAFAGLLVIMSFTLCF